MTLLNRLRQCLDHTRRTLDKSHYSLQLLLIRVKSFRARKSRADMSAREHARVEAHFHNLRLRSPSYGESDLEIPNTILETSNPRHLEPFNFFSVSSACPVRRKRLYRGAFVAKMWVAKFFNVR